MRKLLSILLLATISISICACGATSIKLPENGDINSLILEDNNYDDYVNNNDSNIITLTTNNIEDYLHIELNDSFIDYSSYPGNYGCYSIADLILNIYPISSGTFENVQISFELIAPNEWGFLDGDFRVNADYSQTQNIGLYFTLTEKELFLSELLQNIYT